MRNNYIYIQIYPNKDNYIKIIRNKRQIMRNKINLINKKRQIYPNKDNFIQIMRNKDNFINKKKTKKTNNEK